MEKAILKTLIYADIFNFPLKAWEIHKWLIGKKANLKQMEKALSLKSLELRVKNYKGYYFLSETKKRGLPHFLKGKASLVRQRINRQIQSDKYLREAKLVGWFLKIVPWIKLIGVSGSLAMRNSSKKDDLDLFIVTSKNRLFLSRFFIILLLSLLGKRRSARDLLKEAAGKICVNLLLDEDSLVQEKKDLYTAHEVLQMEPLWFRGGIYGKYLSDNDWVFKFLPNWRTSILTQKSKLKSQNYNSKFKIFFDISEILARKMQLKYMKPPKGKEKVTPSALYFHPLDYGPEILRKYAKRVKNL